MNRPEKLLHGLFFLFTFIWLSALLFYQDFGHLRYQPLVRGEAVAGTDEDKIKVICDPICYFLADGKRIRSRTDSDAAGGLLKVTLRFYDAYHGLIGYEDDNPNPNFFVIDTTGEFLQVVRLKLPRINFVFAGYCPDQQLIQFQASSGKKVFYSANKPELLSL